MDAQHAKETLEMENPTETLLDQIRHPEATPRLVAMTLALASRSRTRVDAQAVADAIQGRWGLDTLAWIVARAESGECFEDDCPVASHPRRCRVCGCTDEDCSGCIERTGEPCYWVEEDLCSACAPKRWECKECGTQYTDREKGFGTRCWQGHELTRIGDQHTNEATDTSPRGAGQDTDRETTDGDCM